MLTFPIKITDPWTSHVTIVFFYFHSLNLYSTKKKSTQFRGIMCLKFKKRENKTMTYPDIVIHINIYSRQQNDAPYIIFFIFVCSLLHSDRNHSKTTNNNNHKTHEIITIFRYFIHSVQKYYAGSLRMHHHH